MKRGPWTEFGDEAVPTKKTEAVSRGFLSRSKPGTCRDEPRGEETSSRLEGGRAGELQTGKAALLWGRS